MRSRIVAGALALVMAGQAQALTVGQAPPDGLGVDRSGREVLVSEQHGKVLVVSFWASWCGYCRKELPVLAGLQEAAGKERVEVVAINTMDDREVYLSIRRKLRDVKLTMTRDASGSVGKAYGVNGIPHLLIIDRQGKVAFELTGYGEDSLDDIVDQVNRQLVLPSTAAAGS
jgi:thiol-disulfide isomerase/thioredoxin